MATARNYPRDFAKNLHLETWLALLPPEKRRLGLFIFLALLGHLAAFYTIQIRYPQASLQRGSRGEVTLLSRERMAPAAQASLEFWDEVREPSFIILPQGPLLDVATLTGQLQEPRLPVAPPPSLIEAADSQKYDFLPEGLPALSDRVLDEATPAPRTFRYTEPPAPLPTQTQIEWPTTFQSRLIGPGPALPSPTSETLTESGATVLRAGLGGDGRVRYVLVEKSCGRASIDNVAVEAVRRASFKPVDNSTTAWGKVIVYWQFKSEPPPASAPAVPATEIKP